VLDVSDCVHALAPQFVGEGIQVTRLDPYRSLPFKAQVEAAVGAVRTHQEARRGRPRRRLNVERARRTRRVEVNWHGRNVWRQLKPHTRLTPTGRRPGSSWTGTKAYQGTVSRHLKRVAIAVFSQGVRGGDQGG
jgi:hypothetical protein